MKIDISVIVPGIRVKNWLRLYESVGSSFSGSWEIVFISPYELPDELKGLGNVKLIKDYGTPIRCQQIGLINCSGDFVTWAADDGYYTPGTLDKAFHSLENIDYKNVVVGKYSEGEDKQNIQVMAGWEYYALRYHGSTNIRYVPQDGIILNVGLIPRKLVMEVGGWDCQFEVCPMSYSDLSIRLSHFGTNFIKQDGIMFICGHMPGRTGDHAPIHDAQITHDEPLLKEIYSSKDSLSRMIIDINNWQQSPSRWERRFGKE